MQLLIGDSNYLTVLDMENINNFFHDLNIDDLLDIEKLIVDERNKRIQEIIGFR